MTPEAELLDIFSDLRRSVADLAVWAVGPHRLHALLRAALIPRAEFARRGREVPSFPWESLVDCLLQWHYAYPVGSGKGHDDEILEALDLAIMFTRLEPLEAGIRAGVYRVRRTGGAFRVVHRWDVAPEVADFYLERRAQATTFNQHSAAEIEWASRQERQRFGVFEPPNDLLRIASDRAMKSINGWRSSQSEGCLSEEFDLGAGLTVGAMAKVLAVLMAVADLVELGHRSVDYPGTTLMHVSRGFLVEALTQLCDGVQAATIEIAIDRLCAGPGKSARTSLLIPHDKFVTILPLLMFPRAIDPIMLRTATYDARRYGVVGRRQGERAAAWAAWLRDIPGVQVAERLPVDSTDGRTAGDLDVVAVDVATLRGVIYEVKWPIDAVTLPEVVKADKDIMAAAKQLGGVRRLLTSGAATVRMPAGWPEFAD